MTRAEAMARAQEAFATLDNKADILELCDFLSDKSIGVGAGRKIFTALSRQGITTVGDLRKLPENWKPRHGSGMGAKTLLIFNEMRGVASPTEYFRSSVGRLAALMGEARAQEVLLNELSKDELLQFLMAEVSKDQLIQMARDVLMGRVEE